MKMMPLLLMILILGAELLGEGGRGLNLAYQILLALSPAMVVGIFLAPSQSISVEFSGYICNHLELVRDLTKRNTQHYGDTDDDLSAQTRNDCTNNVKGFEPNVPRRRRTECLVLSNFSHAVLRSPRSQTTKSFLQISASRSKRFARPDCSRSPRRLETGRLA